LVKWGFNYHDLVTMPIEEFLEYSNLYYKEQKRKKDQEDGIGQEKPDGQSIGQTLPGQFPNQ